MENERDEMDEKMQRLSDWLTVPIYVYHGTAQISQLNSSQGFFWARFEPASQQRMNKDCRFYITLFHNRIVRGKIFLTKHENIEEYIFYYKNNKKLIKNHLNFIAGNTVDLF